MVSNPEWIKDKGIEQMNDPDYHHMIYFGFGSASEFAKLMDLVRI